MDAIQLEISCIYI